MARFRRIKAKVDSGRDSDPGFRKPAYTKHRFQGRFAGVALPESYNDLSLREALPAAEPRPGHAPETNRQPRNICGPR